MNLPCEVVYQRVVEVRDSGDDPVEESGLQVENSS